MADRFGAAAESISGPGLRHLAIVPSDTVDLPDVPRVIYCLTSGTIQVMDRDGNTLPYPMTAGDRLEFRAKRIMATNTTGTYYSWS